MDNIQSVNNQDKSQEQVILRAASKIFMSKGYDGARMQEIADEAGINKALLHYYFRSKEQLFQNILRQAFRNFWPTIEPVIASDKSDIHKVIKAIVEGYINMVEKMPYLPNFIIGEINRDPGKVAELIRESGVKPQMVILFFKNAMAKGEIVTMDPRELIIYIIGLCVFPVVSRPLTGQLLYDNVDDYNYFMNNRKETVYNFICRAICLENTNR